MVSASRAKRHLVVSFLVVWLFLSSSVDASFHPRPAAATQPTTRRDKQAPKKSTNANVAGRVLLATGCAIGVTVLEDDDLKRKVQWSWGQVQQGLRQRVRVSLARRAHHNEEECRKRQREYLVKRKRRRQLEAWKNLIVGTFWITFWIGGLIALQVWQQVPTRVAKGAVEIAKTALDILLPLASTTISALGTVLMVALVFASVVALILLFPTLWMQGEAIRDDLQNARSPLDPYSRTSRNFRRIAEGLDSL